MKMPEPMTAPTPKAVRLQGPRLRRSLWSACSDDAISASMLCVRRSLLMEPRALTLSSLALCQNLHFFLHGAAVNGGGTLGLGGRFLAGGALQLLAFFGGFNVFRIHPDYFRFLTYYLRPACYLRPANFSTNFFIPWRWKLTMIFASSPSPSRRTIVPLPYLGCSTTVPVWFA